ncbi:hypothetical protein COT77_02555 [Candidatus Berkelbacteria bacterium CG10_big_fil_rev_8_21_14_0_10_41_12]|uniref:DUF8128 domain-containing protein n=1 Tax=Candidatus Berkelbacteria bacterium CG10_big_fil_rev_8_21_14_0_10_41_12 TaxID=1974513 RepID=A0A2M6WWX7_9BACT|nr:MAG: hypothetical protein COT77_02555 [Candidatus Berkelbacteria bacterium CG10_big_fil_rev_8_21_14_0_10_41_12]
MEETTIQIDWLTFSLYLAGFAVVAIAIYLIWRKSYRKKLAERSSDIVMLEVRVPKKLEKKEYETLKSFSELTSVADQMFASLNSLYVTGIKGFLYGQPKISFELVAKDKEIIFYVGTPKYLQSLVEKQILSFYQQGQIDPGVDFRIFKEGMKSAVGIVTTTKRYLYPIKTYTELNSDTINNITNALSKLGEDGRATVQMVISPANPAWRQNIDYALGRIREGKSVPAMLSWYGRAFFYFSDVIAHWFRSQTTKDKGSTASPLQEESVKLLTQKSAKSGFLTQIRIVSLAKTEEEAEMNLRNIFSAYAQLGAPDRNNFKLKINLDKKAFITHFILRDFYGLDKMLLNCEELASVYHFPNEHIETPGIRWFLAKRASAPSGIPQEGLVLGENIYRGEKTIVRIKDDDRRRHIYAIGMTGTGKSTLFETMILQDIYAGRGVALFDPHGETVENILAKIPKSRVEDVIYFNPADTQRPMGLNLLEWKTQDEKDFLVQESIQIFYKLFDPNAQGFIGPQFEHWMRNAALTLMEYPQGGTLIEIPKLFTDDGFRQDRINYVQDPVVQAFWNQQLAKTADFHKSEMYNYFISKFGRFMTNHTMRNIIGQAKSAFDLRSVMDSRKILLVDLAKGKIGETNSNLLGMILITKLMTAALSRVDIDEEQRKDFYLYVDEFQNFATDTFSVILSEARKFRLNLNITNQYIAQIPEPIRDAIIGNVGTLISFRIGVPDAEFMEKEFEPVFNKTDLNNIEAFNAYVKLLVDKAPLKPFSMKTIKSPLKEDMEMRKAVSQLSSLKYGRDISIVEAEISNRVRSYTPVEQERSVARESGL